MTETQALFDHWMNSHRDAPEVTQRWKEYEACLDYSVPLDIAIRLNGMLQPYLQELERQAYCAGVASGIFLAVECVAAKEKCPV